MRKIYYLLFFCIAVVFTSCSSDNESVPEEVSPVVLDLNTIPYEKLSDYNLFKSPISDFNPVYGVIPYEPISSLFSDYASKKRFIWMPEGVSAHYAEDMESLDFPVGTILVKNFYYENVLPERSKKLLETRLMILTETNWVFANYVWNESQTEAFYNMEGSYVDVTWDQNGETKNVSYRIPNGAECVTCHNKGGVALPIGTKPQSLNKDFNFDTGSQNQLEKLRDFGYLNDYPNNITTVVNYADFTQPLELRVRSYLDINCAHCHSDEGFCNYRAPRFSFSRTFDWANMGVCVEPQEDISLYIEGNPTHIIKPGEAEKSIIFYRLNTNRENIRMPLRGRNIVHEEGVAMITQWINSLENNDCN